LKAAAIERQPIKFFRVYLNFFRGLRFKLSISCDKRSLLEESIVIDNFGFETFSFFAVVVVVEMFFAICNGSPLAALRKMGCDVADNAVKLDLFFFSCAANNLV